MKFLIFVFLLVPLSIFGQKDFDYMIYTSKSTQKTISDSLVLYLNRNFEKRRNLLTEINNNDPTSIKTYEIRFLGGTNDKESWVLLYDIIKIDNQKVEGFLLKIDPVFPYVVIENKNKNLYIYYY